MMNEITSGPHSGEGQTHKSAVKPALYMCLLLNLRYLPSIVLLLLPSCLLFDHRQRRATMLTFASLSLLVAVASFFNGTLGVVVARITARDGTPGLNYDPSALSYCTWWVDVSISMSCDTMLAGNALTLAQFRILVCICTCASLIEDLEHTLMLPLWQESIHSREMRRACSRELVLCRGSQRRAFTFLGPPNKHHSHEREWCSGQNGDEQWSIQDGNDDDDDDEQHSSQDDGEQHHSFHHNSSVFFHTPRKRH